MFLLAINWGNALIVTLFGFLLVVVVLVLLVFIIDGFGKLMAQKIIVPKISLKQEGSKTVAVKSETEFDEVQLTAGQSAAIAMAIHLYYADVHDEESNVMTIKTVERRYSPWSSKIYSINNLIR